MLNDSNPLQPSALLGRAAAVTLFACVATLGLRAQQSAPAPAAAAPATVKLDLTTPSQLNFSNVDGVAFSSSSAPLDQVDPVQAATLDFKGIEGLQPPPRRRYGRPRYNDSNHNPDGSNKYAFVAGIGAALPTGNLHKYDTPSYGFQIGFGRNFNKNAGVLLQFDYDKFGFQGSTLANQTNLYNYYCTPALQASSQCSLISGLDGTSHIWSFTLDPTYNIYSGEGLGAYVVAGVGFYHKTANFTVPAVGTYCDYYYGCYQYQANQTIDKYSANGVGFNGGFGLTFKPSRFAGERFYAEARYVFVDNQHRAGITTSSPIATLNTYNGNNFYPQNSNRSAYVPIKIGIRF